MGIKTHLQKKSKENIKLVYSLGWRLVEQQVLAKDLMAEEPVLELRQMNQQLNRDLTC